MVDITIQTPKRMYISNEQDKDKDITKSSHKKKSSKKTPQKIVSSQYHKKTLKQMENQIMNLLKRLKSLKETKDLYHKKIEELSKENKILKNNNEELENENNLIKSNLSNQKEDYNKKLSIKNNDIIKLKDKINNEKDISANLNKNNKVLYKDNKKLTDILDNSIISIVPMVETSLGLKRSKSFDLGSDFDETNIEESKRPKTSPKKRKVSHNSLKKIESKNKNETKDENINEKTPLKNVNPRRKLIFSPKTPNKSISSKYLNKTEKQMNNDIQNLIKKINTLQNTIKDYQDKYDKIEKEYKIITNKYNDLQNENNEIKLKLSNKDIKYNELLQKSKKQKASSVSPSKRKISKKIQSNTPNNDLNKSITQINNKVTVLTNKNNQLHNQLQKSDEKIAELNTKYKSLQKEKENSLLEKNNEIKNLNNSINKIKKDIQNKNGDIEKYKSNYNIIKDKYNLKEKEYNKLLTEKDSLQKKYEELELINNKKTQDILSKIDDIKKMNSSINNYKNNIKDYKEEKIKLEDEIMKLKLPNGNIYINPTIIYPKKTSSFKIIQNNTSILYTNPIYKQTEIINNSNLKLIDINEKLTNKLQQINSSYKSNKLIIYPINSNIIKNNKLTYQQNNQIDIHNTKKLSKKYNPVVRFINPNIDIYELKINELIKENDLLNIENNKLSNLINEYQIKFNNYSICNEFPPTISENGINLDNSLITEEPKLYYNKSIQTNIIVEDNELNKNIDYNRDKIQLINEVENLRLENKDIIEENNILKRKISEYSINYPLQYYNLDDLKCISEITNVILDDDLVFVKNEINNLFTDDKQVYIKTDSVNLTYNSENTFISDNINIIYDNELITVTNLNSFIYQDNNIIVEFKNEAILYNNNLSIVNEYNSFEYDENLTITMNCMDILNNYNSLSTTTNNIDILYEYENLVSSYLNDPIIDTNNFQIQNYSSNIIYKQPLLKEIQYDIQLLYSKNEKLSNNYFNIISYTHKFDKIKVDYNDINIINNDDPSIIDDKSISDSDYYNEEFNNINKEINSLIEYPITNLYYKLNENQNITQIKIIQKPVPIKPNYQENKSLRLDYNNNTDKYSSLYMSRFFNEDKNDLRLNKSINYNYNNYPQNYPQNYQNNYNKSIIDYDNNPIDTSDLLVYI